MVPRPILVTPVLTQSVVVLGGSAAGLVAAYTLSRQGCRVTWIDSDGQRAGWFNSGLPRFPILGCHRATQAFLQSLGGRTLSPMLSESSLEFLLPNGRLAQYPKSLFPNPLHQMLTIGRFAGLPWNVRWKLLSWLERIWEGALELSTDLEHRTANDWIASLEHGQAVLSTIWNPLALWLTGTDPRTLSADAFLSALKAFFLSHSHDSRVYVLSPASRAFLTERATAALADSGVTVMSKVQPLRLDYQDDRLIGVRLSDGALLQGNWYISALPIEKLTPLLPERWLSRYAYFQQITELSTTPWTVVELPITDRSTHPRQILAGNGTVPIASLMPFESDHRMIASLSIPGHRELQEVLGEMATSLHALRLIPESSLLDKTIPPPRHERILTLSPGAKTRRPIQRSPIANLLLAGAWTDTGWPANLESAVVSAERCADVIGHERPA